MKLEEALKLKKRDVERASESYCAPQSVTKGREYELQRNAEPLYASDFSINHRKTKDPNEKPCNAILPIIDDDGQYKEVVYIGFEIVRKAGEGRE